MRVIGSLVDFTGLDGVSGLVCGGGGAGRGSCSVGCVGLKYSSEQVVRPHEIGMRDDTVEVE